MDEHALRELIGDVKAGRLGRRHFGRIMVGLGLTAPLAARVLASAGVAEAQARPADSSQAGPFSPCFSIATAFCLNFWTLPEPVIGNWSTIST